MTGVDDRVVNEHDLETPDSIQVRFGITYLESDPAAATAAMTMAMPRYRNPFTGAPTIGPLAILVDAAAGIVNHYRRRPGQWTVSSELSMDVNLDGIGDLDGPVLGHGARTQPIGLDVARDLHAVLRRHRDRRRHRSIVLRQRRRPFLRMALGDIGSLGRDVRSPTGWPCTSGEMRSATSCRSGSIQT